MSDIVVTVPKDRWREWLSEGDLADEPYAGLEEYHFYVPTAPAIDPGERVYVVAHGKLRGYAPLVRVDRTASGFGLVRHGGAVAVTLDQPVRGFQGWRYRWWDRTEERPFPDWRSP